MDDFSKDFSNSQAPTWNGNKLSVDSNKWTVWENSNSDKKPELGKTLRSFLTAENISVSDGNLHLKASLDSETGCYKQAKMSTGMLQWTQDANDWTGNPQSKTVKLSGYSFAEIRFKVPPKEKVIGSFAFYYEPDGYQKLSSGKNFSEVDMFEYLGHSNNFNTTILNSETKDTGKYVPQGEEWRVRNGPKDDVFFGDDFYDSWHIFQFAWTKDGYTAYMDGQVIYNNPKINNKYNSPANYYSNGYTLVVGLDFDYWDEYFNTGIPSSYPYPDFEPFEYLVDYIKVYKEK